MQKQHNVGGGLVNIEGSDAASSLENPGCRVVGWECRGAVTALCEAPEARRSLGQSTGVTGGCRHVLTRVLRETPGIAVKFNGSLWQLQRDSLGKRPGRRTRNCQPRGKVCLASPGGHSGTATAHLPPGRLALPSLPPGPLLRLPPALLLCRPGHALKPRPQAAGAAGSFCGGDS